jgi:hypothetical protein
VCVCVCVLCVCVCVCLPQLPMYNTMAFVINGIHSSSVLTQIMHNWNRIILIHTHTHTPLKQQQQQQQLHNDTPNNLNRCQYWCVAVNVSNIGIGPKFYEHDHRGKLGENMQTLRNPLFYNNNNNIQTSFFVHAQ